MYCTQCGCEIKSSKKMICKSCADNLFYSNIMSILDHTKKISEGNEYIIKYLAGQNRCSIMGVKTTWTELYSREALKAIKSKFPNFDGKTRPSSVIQKEAEVTFDHYYGGTLVLANLIHEYIKGKVKNNKDIERYIIKKFVITCVTKSQNKKLALLQNENNSGFHSYKQYRDVVGDLVHFDQSLVSENEIKKYFS